MQREALLSALSNGERWQDVVSLVKAMLAKLLVVDNPTAGLAMKAYANLGLKENWRSVSLRCGALRRSGGCSEHALIASYMIARVHRCSLGGRY